MNNNTDFRQNDLSKIYVSKTDLSTHTNEVKKEFQKLKSTINSNHNITARFQKNMIIMYAGMLLAILLSFFTSFVIMNNIAIQFNNELQIINQSINSEHETVQQIKTTIAEKNNTISVTPAASEEVIIDSTPALSSTITYNNSVLSQKSGYSADQFNNIINTTFQKLGKGNTKITGLGEALYNVEQEYNVNGLYILGIGSLESGWGTSSMAKRQNNLYGLMKMKFNSAYDCTIYMGKLLRNNYIDKGLDSLTKIQPVYCPGGSSWVHDVTWCTNKYIATATELYSYNT